MKDTPIIKSSKICEAVLQDCWVKEFCLQNRDVFNYLKILNCKKLTFEEGSEYR